MKNKIIFILILMLFLISTSVFASDITITEFWEVYKNYVREVASDEEHPISFNYGTVTPFVEALENYENFSIFYEVNSSSDGTRSFHFFVFFYNDLNFYIRNDNLLALVSNSDSEKYALLDNVAYPDTTGKMTFNANSLSVSTPTWSLDSDSNLYYWKFNHPSWTTIDCGLDNYKVLSTTDIYDGFNTTKVKYYANVGDVTPEVRLPVLSSLNDLYTEKSESIDLTIYNNSTDLKHYIVLKRFLVDTQEEDPNFTIWSINYFKEDKYYNEVTDSWILPLQLFNEFTFSSEYYYMVYLRCPELEDPIVDTAGPFMVNFSDDFNPSTGSSYDIIPTITALPLSASAQKTVTITSPVDNAVIYYKLGPDNPWQLYSSPVTVTENCRVYALLYGIDGSSATAQLDITNIADMTNFENRPNVGPRFAYSVNTDSGYSIVTFWVEAAKNLKIEYSTDGSFWNDYTSISEYSGFLGNPVNVDYDAYKTELKLSLPKTVYFRYIDENGFYSPITSKHIPAKKTGLVPETVEAGIVDLYDENGNYLPDINNNKDNSSFDISGLLGENGEVDFDNIISSGLDMGWSIITHFGDFFVLMQGLFIFIPNDIMIIIVGLLIIKFIIALIGFLRG